MAYEEGCIHFKARQRDQLTDITVLQEIMFYLSGLYDNILNKTDKKAQKNDNSDKTIILEFWKNYK